jgi:DNA-binding transcriptional regulator YhcF (GntR family)
MVRPVDKRSEAGAIDARTVTIDRDAEVPIGVQLAWALRSRIGNGTYGPGHRLPAIRDFADAVGVNVNTVRAVYQGLEREGLISSQQGAGTFVAAAPLRGSEAGIIAASAAREALASGVDPREVAAALYVADASSAHRTAEAEERSEAARRRILRRQIGSLERALGEIEAEHPGVAPRTAGARRRFAPGLLGAHELEQVRTDLVRRLATVQAAIDEREQQADAGPRAAPRKAKGAKAASTSRSRTRIRPATAPGT